MMFILGGAVFILAGGVLFLFLHKNKGRQLKKAVHFESEGKVNEAYLCYEAVLASDPGNLTARWRLALMAIARGAYPRAVSELQALLARREYPEKVQEHHVHFALGKAFVGMDSLANAFVAYYKGLQLNPGHPEGNLRMGLLYASQQKNDKALKYLKTAVGMNEQYGEGFYYLGLLHADMGDFQSAIECLEKAGRYAGEKPEVDLYLGMFYRDRKMFPDAIRKLQKLVKNSVDPALRVEGYRLLGLCYKEKGLIDDAITHYEVAANEAGASGSQEKQKEILYNLGMAYTKRGQGDKAMEVWSSLRAVDSAYKDVNELIAKGKNGFTTRAFEHALESWERISDKESGRLRGSGLLKGARRFDIDKLARELGGDHELGAADPKNEYKPVLERFIELNNKQFQIAAQRMLKVLGFTIHREVKSDADPDFDEGKAIAFVASRVHPRTKKNVAYLVQIRRFRENVGPIPVGNCLDMMQELSLENSIFFVSSSFTEAALNIVQRDNRVQLVDRTGLVKVLRKIIK